MNTKTEPDPTKSFQSIKLGIDAHAKWYYVARQVDGATPQPGTHRLQLMHILRSDLAVEILVDPDDVGHVLDAFLADGTTQHAPVRFSRRLHVDQPNCLPTDPQRRSATTVAAR